MIRRATGHDLDVVTQTLMERFAWERRKGAYSGWISGVWPSRSTVRRLIAKDELSVLRDDRGEGVKIYGSIAISSEQPAEYRPLKWIVRAGPKEVLTVKMLCVTPLLDRQGLGTQLLRYALGVAARTGAKAVRLHCAPANVPMAGLCQKLGFRHICELTLPLFEGAEPKPYSVWEFDVRAIRNDVPTPSRSRKR